MSVVEEKYYYLANVFPGDAVMVPGIVRDIVESELNHIFIPAHAKQIYSAIFNPTYASNIMGMPTSPLFKQLLSTGFIAKKDYANLLKEIPKVVENDSFHNSLDFTKQMSLCGSRIEVSAGRARSRTGSSTGMTTRSQTNNLQNKTNNEHAGVSQVQANTRRRVRRDRPVGLAGAERHRGFDLTEQATDRSVNNKSMETVQNIEAKLRDFKLYLQEKLENIPKVTDKVSFVDELLGHYMQEFQNFNGKDGDDTTKNIALVEAIIKHLHGTLHVLNENLLMIDTSLFEKYTMHIRGYVGVVSLLGAAALAGLLISLAVIQVQFSLGDYLITVAESRFDGSHPGISKDLASLKQAYFDKSGKYTYMESLVPAFVTRLGESRRVGKKIFETHTYTDAIIERDFLDVHFHDPNLINTQEVMQYFLMCALLGMVFHTLRRFPKPLFRVLKTFDFKIVTGLVSGLGFLVGIVISFLGSSEDTSIDGAKATEVWMQYYLNELFKPVENFKDGLEAATQALMEYGDRTVVYEGFEHIKNQCISNGDVATFLVHTTYSIFNIFDEIQRSTIQVRESGRAHDSGCMIALMGSIMMGWGVVMKYYIYEILGTVRIGPSSAFSAFNNITPTEFLQSRIMLTQMYSSTLTIIFYLGRSILVGSPTKSNLIDMALKSFQLIVKYYLNIQFQTLNLSSVAQLFREWITDIGSDVAYNQIYKIACSIYQSQDELSNERIDSMLEDYKHNDKLSKNLESGRMIQCVDSFVRDAFFSTTMEKLVTLTRDKNPDNEDKPMFWSFIYLLSGSTHSVWTVIRDCAESEWAGDLLNNLCLAFASFQKSAINLVNSNELRLLKLQVVNRFYELYNTWIKENHVFKLVSDEYEAINNSIIEYIYSTFQNETLDSNKIEQIQRVIGFKNVADSVIRVMKIDSTNNVLKKNVFKAMLFTKMRLTSQESGRPFVRQMTANHDNVMEFVQQFDNNKNN